MLPTQWSVSRTTGLKTGRPVVTGAATRVEVVADLLEIAADAAAVVVPARWPVEGAARTAAAEGAARFAAAVGLARSWVVVAAAAGRAGAAACNGGPG